MINIINSKFLTYSKQQRNKKQPFLTHTYKLNNQNNTKNINSYLGTIKNQLIKLVNDLILGSML